MGVGIVHVQHASYDFNSYGWAPQFRHDRLLACGGSIRVGAPTHFLRMWYMSPSIKLVAVMCLVYTF